MIALWIQFVIYMYGRTKRSYRYAKYEQEKNKRFKQQALLRQEMLAKKEPHEWTNIMLSNGVKVLVCKKTGYCPSHEVFVDIRYVQSQLKAKEMQEKFNKHKADKIKKWAGELNLSESQVANLIEEAYAMKKQFFLEKMDEEINKMKKE